MILRKRNILAVAVVLAGTLAAAAQAADRQTIEALIDVERTLLEEDLAKMSALSADRTQAELGLRTMYRTLDDILGMSGEGNAVQAELIFKQIQGAEDSRRMIFAAQQSLIDRIIGLKRKLELMQESLGDLSREAAEQGLLTGTWRVVMMPVEQNGAFNLTQTGTLVSGTYSLAGGWSGSLQGTLVNRKVYLVRIDSKLGRSMEFEGVLSGDGESITGTWLNYDLGGQGGAQGQWTATRVRRGE